MNPIALSVAGSDPSGGAGIQADLKTFSAFRVYGMCAITALTAQNTRGVSGVFDISPDFVRDQIRSVLSDIAPGAAKTGMLSTAAIVEAVAEALSARQPRFPLVVDPVMIASSGDRLLREDAMQALREALIPQADILTPNAHEAEALSGVRVASRADAERAAGIILALGPRAVLIKGGHRAGDSCDDLFAAGDGERAWLEGARHDQSHTHGTGCVLSAAIAAAMARGYEALDACRLAKRFIDGAIRHAWPLGGGIGPVDTLWNIAHDPCR